MDQKQRLDYLVEKFKEDSGEYRNLKVSDNDVEKRRILRSLMNIRMPRHMDEEILKVQDEFLKSGDIALPDRDFFRKRHSTVVRLFYRRGLIQDI